MKPQTLLKTGLGLILCILAVAAVNALIGCDPDDPPIVEPSTLYFEQDHTNASIIEQYLYMTIGEDNGFSTAEIVKTMPSSSQFSFTFIPPIQNKTYKFYCVFKFVDERGSTFMSAPCNQGMPVEWRVGE